MTNLGDLAYCLLGLGAFLWCLGGYKWKWVRRAIWPISCGLMAFGYGIVEYNRLLFIPCLFIACSMGYGDKAPIWKRVLTVIALGACLLPLGWHWAIIPTISGGFGLLYWFSLKKGLPWKLCETYVGLAQGYWIATLILKG